MYNFDKWTKFIIFHIQSRSLICIGKCLPLKRITIYHGNHHTRWILGFLSIGLSSLHDKKFYTLNKTQEVSIAAWKLNERLYCSIPVGCILPAAVAIGGDLHEAPPGTRDPPRTKQPHPCEQNSWHTLVKILPCPKLRLRAVKKQKIYWLPDNYGTRNCTDVCNLSN